MQSKRKNAPREYALTAVLFLLLALAMYEINEVTEGVRAAMALCARAIIPTLFPFLVLSDLLLSLDGAKRLLALPVRPLLRPLRLSSAGGVAFLLGALFGFPLGARLTARAYSEGAISREEAERLLLFSGNASPFFLIGSVGIGMLSSLRAGLLLYLLQLSLSLATGLVLARFAPMPSDSGAYASISERRDFSLSSTVRTAITQSLAISGYVLLFSAAAALFLPFCQGKSLSRLLLSLLEIGNACAHSAAARDGYSLSFCAFAVSFSGLSVYFQTLDVIDGTKLSTRRYLPVKLLTGALGFFIVLLFSARG